jgi:hypothetical protein
VDLQLSIGGDGEFEAAGKMMKKDLTAFLNRWKPAAPWLASRRKAK